MEALNQAQTYKYWFRQKYQLPPLDPRYLAMTNEGIVREFWADRFYRLIEQGKAPTVDYFDTDFVDDAIEKWAKEDSETIEVERLKADPDEWEEVSHD